MTDKKDHIGPQLAQLIDLTDRLKGLLGEWGSVTKARSIPEAVLRTFDQRVQIQGRDPSYDSDVAVASAVALAKEIHTRCRAEQFVEAEAKRDAVLLEIAQKLTIIRGSLPALATQVAIELGGTAKDLRFEAEHGRS